MSASVLFVFADVTILADIFTCLLWYWWTFFAFAVLFTFFLHTLALQTATNFV